MPLGRLLRGIDRVTGDNIFGNLAGVAGRAIGRRNRRTAAADSAAGGTMEPTAAPALSAATPVPVPPAPPQLDTFNRTGTAVGAAAGGTLGAVLGPVGAAAGTALGGSIGNTIGSQIPVPGQRTSQAPTVSDPSAVLSLLGSGSSRANRRAVAEYLLASGALNGIIRQPVVYQASNGRVRYGSDLGFVLIRRMNGGRQVVFQAPREIARSLGWWRPRRKPVLSVRDSNAIRRANTARNSVERIAKNSGLYCSKNRPTRTSRTTRTTRR